MELKLFQGYKVLLYFVSSVVKSCDSQRIRIQLEESKENAFTLKEKKTTKAFSELGNRQDNKPNKHRSVSTLS